MRGRGPTLPHLRLLITATVLVGAASAAGAGTLTVTDCGDTTPGGGGPGQLRRLINDAGPGDVILVPACTISLNGGGPEDANDTGDLDIGKNLTIQGTGATTVITAAGGLTDRLLQVLPGAVVTLSQLTLTGAATNLNGAGIYNQGELHLAGVTVSNNMTFGTAGGGGINNDAGASVFLVDSTVQGNGAPGGSGGGISNKGSASLTRSTVAQNTSVFAGGGISNLNGAVTLTDSTVSGNQASGQTSGGGIASYGAGTVTITGSTISGNTTWMTGGGIYSESTLTITNSTISGNHLTGPGAMGGGGLSIQYPSPASLIRVTIADNTAGDGTGTAIYNNGGFTGLTLKATLIAGDCGGVSPIVSHGHNLEEGTSCGLSGTGDLSNVGDAGLGPLQDNGGPTLTHLPRFDSPAVDAGGATCSGAPTDQRGVARPQGAACDIGAVEWNDLLFQDGFESGDLSRWSFNADGGGHLSVSAGAALASTGFGLQAAVSDTSGLYVEDLTPFQETRYRARFYFDPNGFDPGESMSHFRTRVFLMFDDAGTRRLSALVLKRQNNNYFLMQRCRRDDNSQEDTGFFPISDAPHWVLLEWRRATGVASADGVCALTIDGTTVATLSDVQDNVSTLGMVRLGTMNVKDGASGTPFFDEFVSKRVGAIPPLP